MDAIYLDHNASTPIPNEILEELVSIAGRCGGNPSSLHSRGRQARREVNQATESAARFIDCDPELVYWTSGASEANSWALQSAFERARELGRESPHVVLSSIEHDSVLLAAAALERQGAKTESLRVTPDGLADLSHLRCLLDSGPTDLVSVMYANNETGVIQPVHEIAAICRDAGAVPLHIDCVQALAKIPISVRQLKGATYLTFSGHKVGAPKGVGFLVVNGEGRLLFPIVHGRQQKTLRGGTENPFGTACLGRLLEGVAGGVLPIFPESLAALHRDFESEIARRVPGARVHGAGAPRLPNTTYVGFEDADGDGILINLDLEGICASAGSACTSGSVDPSHVLMSMGQDKMMARSSVRFSSGYRTTWDELDQVLAVLPGIVERVRKASVA